MTASRIERRPNPPRITTSISRVPSPLRSSHGFAYAKHIVTPSPSLREAHGYAEHTMPLFREVHRSAKHIVMRSPSLCKVHRDIVPRSLWFRAVHPWFRQSPWFRETHRYAEHIVPTIRGVHRYAKSIVMQSASRHRSAKSIVTRNTSLHGTHCANDTRSPSLCKAHLPPLRQVHHYAKHIGTRSTYRPIVTRSTPGHRYAKPVVYAKPND